MTSVSGNESITEPSAALAPAVPPLSSQGTPLDMCRWDGLAPSLCFEVSLIDLQGAAVLPDGRFRRSGEPLGRAHLDVERQLY